MQLKSFIILLFCYFQTVSNLYCQNNFPYKNKKNTINERVEDLILRMTPEEKFWQLFMIAGDNSNPKENYKNGIFGFQVNTTKTDNEQILNYSDRKEKHIQIKQFNSIQKYFIDSTRLGIPVIFFDEALHGLVRKDAIAFPQSIGLAATFDRKLMHQISASIAADCKSRGIRQILSPVVNLGTDVRWGRMEETYGEDPYLVSEMSVQYVKSFEEMGIITTPKHFVVNHGDGGKDSYPIHFSKRFLDETYFVPFKACIERGGSRSIMTAYNSFDGSPCSANNWLLNDILKKEWGFKGFVISDASGTGGANVLHYTAKNYPDAGKKAVENGLDVIFQTDYNHYKLFQPPFLDGTIDQKIIDNAVKRVLKAKFELGLFDNPYISENIDPLHASDPLAIAKKAALESFVLLKNKNELLPLSTYKKIALIGEDAAKVRLGGYSGPGHQNISILEGLKQFFVEKISYHPGCGRKNQEWITFPTEFVPNGFKANYYNNIAFENQPILQRKDNNIDFDWSLFAPDPIVNNSFYSAIWEGDIFVNQQEDGFIGIKGNDGYKLYIDQQLMIDRWDETYFNTTFSTQKLNPFQKYHIKLLFKSPTGNSKIQLIWKSAIKNDAFKKIAEARKVVEQNDVAVVVVGIEEGEFQDRSSLKLPGQQESLILELAKTGKPVIVLISGGSAVNMQNWMDSVGTIAQIWYPGEQGGHAIADILLGKYNPAGRLPFSYPLHEGHLPYNYNHQPTGRGDDYISESGLPLFPFGYGLSYTKFEYKNLKINKQHYRIGENVDLEFEVTNVGKYDGEEVVQLYIRDELSSLARPIMELKEFERISIPKGETKKVKFELTPDTFKMLNINNEQIIEPGTFKIMIGSSSRDIRLMDKIEFLAE